MSEVLSPYQASYKKDSNTNYSLVWSFSYFKLILKYYANEEMYNIQGREMPSVTERPTVEENLMDLLTSGELTVEMQNTQVNPQQVK
jgi:hypothetical protein